MFLREKKVSMEIDGAILSQCDMMNIAFFDIETTGFDKETDKVILISFGYLNNKKEFNIKQYYADDLEDEKQILILFKADLNKFDKWCSYNGLAFDEPFIKRRMKVNDIQFNCPSKHIDLYRLIKPYQKQLGMERCNLKSVEKHIGIERKDKIDGGISVELYYEFLNNGDEKIKETILLHNYEDVLNLPEIFKLVYQVGRDSAISKNNLITEKQLGFLRILLKRNKITLNVDLEKISKKAASKLIDHILKNIKNEEQLMSIIDNDNNNIYMI